MGPAQCGLFMYLVVEIVAAFMYPLADNEIKTVRLVFVSIYAFMQLWSIHIMALWGDATYDGLENPYGPFGVGIKKVFNPNNGEFMLVFYPTDRQKFEVDVKDRNKHFNTNCFGDEKQGKANAQMMNMFMGSNDEFDKTMLDRKFPAIENAEWSLDKIFELTPIMFAHGFYAQPSDHLAIQRELASHGYVVFAPAMYDGSCVYTEKQDGTEMPVSMHYKDLMDREKRMKYH